MCGAGRGLGRGEGRCFRLRLTSWRTENFDCEVTGYTEDGNKCGLLVMRCLLTDAKINRCKSNKWPVADKSSNKDVLNQLRADVFVLSTSSVSDLIRRRICHGMVFF
jgi:hypothetical protein